MRDTLDALSILYETTQALPPSLVDTLYLYPANPSEDFVEKQ